jgi:hypothetical protein
MFIPDPGSRSGFYSIPDPESGLNIPDHFSESFERDFRLKMQYVLKFFDADPGSGFFLTLDPGPEMGKIRTRDFYIVKIALYAIVYF